MMRFVLLAVLAFLLPVQAMAQDGERSLLCNAPVAHKPLGNVAHTPRHDEVGEIVVITLSIRVPSGAPRPNQIAISTVRGICMVGGRTTISPTSS